MSRHKQYHGGFTIVEIAIVIVVIAILSAISVVAYNGVQQRAALGAMANDLVDASKEMELAKLSAGTYPTTIPSTAKRTQNVSLSLSRYAVYSGLTADQNAVLFYNICTGLLSEGLGKGKDAANNTNDYISNCTFESNPGRAEGQYWVNMVGWYLGSRPINTTITDTTLATYAASLSPHPDAYHSQMLPVQQNYFNTWHTRFIAQGGTYPIPTFWDHWATPGNGIMKPTLPSPSTPGGGWVTSDKYCIQAGHTKFSLLSSHLLVNEGVESGPCPAST